MEDWKIARKKCRKVGKKNCPIRSDPLIWDFFQGASELLFLPKIGDLLDWTAKNTGRLVRMLPLVFRELSRALFRFSRVVVYRTVRPYFQFWGHHGFYQKSSTSVISGPSSDLQPYFWASRENLLPASKKQRTFNNLGEGMFRLVGCSDVLVPVGTKARAKTQPRYTFFEWKTSLKIPSPILLNLLKKQLRLRRNGKFPLKAGKKLGGALWGVYRCFWLSRRVKQ